MRRIYASTLDFDDIRAEFDIPDEYPRDALEQVGQLRDAFADERVDARDIPFVTIDPAGSMDLDQALHVTERADGFTLRYAIADLGALIPVGSPLDIEAKRRGQTIYIPDGKSPLHPVELSEGVGSLLPDVDRLASLWTIDIDREGSITGSSLERAVIRSRAKLDYVTVQGWFDSGRELPEAVSGLRAFGELRQAQAVARGAVELELPAQEVTFDGAGRAHLGWQARTAVDAWSSQCSLSTGHIAAEIMLDGGVGILRTLRPATEESTREFADAVSALGLRWDGSTSPGEFLHELPRGDVRTLAAHTAATRLLRGADYRAFDGERPEGDDRIHAGVANTYAHATAPLRRLVDRFVTECCHAIVAGTEPASEIRDSLDEVRERMIESGRLANTVDNACISKVEALALTGRIGEHFDAAVTRSSRAADGDKKAKPGEVMILRPPVTAECAGEVRAGTVIDAVVEEANPGKRSVRFRASGEAAATAPTGS